MTRIYVAWLRLRRRLFWWCMERGCWRSSYVVRIGKREPHRGNLCPLHFGRSIQRVLLDEETP